MKILRTLGTISLGAAVGTGFAVANSMADPIADFYKGKRIEMIVGSGPGGGYDQYARLLTRHMGKHIPGNPDFVTRNMDGAGSIVATNFVYNVAPQDGTVIGGIQRGAPMVEILGQSGPQFESAKINWLGSLNNEVGIIGVMKRSGVTTLEDAFTKEAILGTTGPNDTEAFPALMNNTLGTRFRLIGGYPATPPVHLAMQRGEADGVSQSWSSFALQAGDAMKDISILVQLSTSRHPQLTEMGVPFIFDYITAERVQPGFTVEEVETYFRLMLSTKAMGRPFMLGPKVPEARVKALRAAFVETAKDKDFLAEAERTKRDVVLVSGDELQELVVQLAAAPKEVIDRLENLIKFRGPVETAKVELPKHTGEVTKVESGGRAITVRADGKEVSAAISGSRTKVTIGGSEGDRGAIKAGMTCTVVLPSADAKEAVEVECQAGQS